MVKKLFLTDQPTNGFIFISKASDWDDWLRENIPSQLNQRYRAMLRANLRHLLASLECKAGLIQGNDQTQNQYPTLFDPYLRILILEFAAVACSVFEGLGSAHWLHSQNKDGSKGEKVRRNTWRGSFWSTYCKGSEDHSLKQDFDLVIETRDLLHQDRASARDLTNWRKLQPPTFEATCKVIEQMLRRHSHLVPATTNLRQTPA